MPDTPSTTDLASVSSAQISNIETAAGLIAAVEPDNEDVIVRLRGVFEGLYDALKAVVDIFAQIDESQASAAMVEIRDVSQFCFDKVSDYAEMDAYSIMAGLSEEDKDGSSLVSNLMLLHDAMTLLIKGDGADAETTIQFIFTVLQNAADSLDRAVDNMTADPKGLRTSATDVLSKVNAAKNDFAVLEGNGAKVVDDDQAERLDKVSNLLQEGLEPDGTPNSFVQANAILSEIVEEIGLS